MYKLQAPQNLDQSLPMPNYFVCNAKEINFTEQNNMLVSIQYCPASVTALMPCVRLTTVLC